MAVVFFVILFFILLLSCIIFSTLRICIQRMNFSNANSSKIKYDYLIFFDLYFLNQIKILRLKANPEKIKKLNQKMKIDEKIKKADFKKMKEDLPTKEEANKLYKKLNIKLENFHLKLELGTYDVIITSAIITILSSLLGIAIAKVIEHYDRQKYEYIMIPIYQNKNIVKLSLNCIIQVKVVHIINIIFTLIRKRKEKEKDERTSNRRSYDYSYEQY